MYHDCVCHWCLYFYKENSVKHPQTLKMVYDYDGSLWLSLTNPDDLYPLNTELSANVSRPWEAHPLQHNCNSKCFGPGIKQH